MAIAVWMGTCTTAAENATDSAAVAASIAQKCIASASSSEKRPSKCGWMDEDGKSCGRTDALVLDGASEVFQCPSWE